MSRISLPPKERGIFFVAPELLEIPNNRGGGIEQNIFFLTQHCTIPSFVFSPRRKQKIIPLTESSQSRIIYSVFNARKDYPPSSKSFFSMFFGSLCYIPFCLDSIVRILFLNSKIDAVVVFNKFMGALPLVLAKLIKKKTLFMEYNTWPWCYTNDHRPIVFWIHISFWKIIYRLSSAITANSPSIKEVMVSWGADTSKVFFLPTGIDIKGAPNRKRKATESENLVVLYSGRLVEERGADQLPTIIKAVLKNQKNILFKIVGGGPLFNVITDFVKDCNLEKNVEILGQKSRKETIELMEEGDIAILYQKMRTTDLWRF